MSTLSYDVAVIGAGPVGAVAAYAHARRGARVLLAEANPNAARRLAGEWLHPPALDHLRELGIAPLPQAHRTGEGFVVFPDSGDAPFVLPYSRGAGAAVEHSHLVRHLREAAADDPLVTYLPWARVTRIEDQRLDIQRTSDTRVGARELQISAARIVGAGGRASIARQALGLEPEHETWSRMAGVLLSGVTLPFEGMGHVFLGGPGPVLAYRIGADAVRLCFDVPVRRMSPKARAAALWDGFGHVLPAALRPALREELLAGRISWAANQVRARMHYGRRGLALVGDAVGHYHPLTAIGMTLGFGDAVTLAESRRFERYRRRRRRETRVPEMLAVGLYEVFADDSDEAVLIRQAVYDMWRRDPAERARTMRFLGCQDHRLHTFAGSFLRAVAIGTSRLVRGAQRSGGWRHALSVGRDFRQRLRWLGQGLTHLQPPTREDGLAARRALERALTSVRPQAEIVALESRDAQAEAGAALTRGIERLCALQGDDGSWEGEVVWCPMLAAQYVLAMQVLDRRIPQARRYRLIRHFADTQLPDGSWALSEQGEGYLFATTLVYAAARLLGVPADDPLLARARRWLDARGGALAIPSWGKLWLALVGLYAWEGVPRLLPELWALPRALPLHPSRWYCHTRLIYLAMAAVYGARRDARVTPTIEALRAELFPAGWERVDWRAARRALHAGDLEVPPSLALQLAYRLAAALDRAHLPSVRRRLLAELRDVIRAELRQTSHTSISPVSGLLNTLALWLADPEDPDVELAIAGLEGWFWEDDAEGSRVAGARSASWDTSFALSALTAAGLGAHDAPVERAARWLRAQQVLPPRAGAGGWCFGHAWHGWTVSDCTAEAVEALAGLERLDQLSAARALRFILGRQNPDGGFGSYEARGTGASLEWLNPAEMFGGSMTERSYIECTASCVAGIATIVRGWPALATPETRAAVGRAEACLRAAQRADGAFEGSWGVHFVYGTLFGVRGLLEAGVSPVDPAIRKACRWLLARQRPDGAWGEHLASCRARTFIPHPQGQAVQTAWALMALTLAHCPEQAALDRAAAWLAARQDPETGEWPEEQWAGVFFRTAPLDYRLYRRIFPVWALGLYHAREACRLHGAADTPPRLTPARLALHSP